MNKQLFQDKFGADYKKFIESPAGQAFLMVLNTLSPPYEFPKEEHLLVENRGAKRGYQICINNIFALSIVVKTSQDPEPNYGVTSKTQVQP